MNVVVPFFVRISFGMIRLIFWYHLLPLSNGNITSHKNTPPNTNLTIENSPFEDVFPIEERMIFQLAMLVFLSVHRKKRRTRGCPRKLVNG